jgi:uncharacterized protein (DUF433 family)
VRLGHRQRVIVVERNGKSVRELTRITLDPDVMGGKPCIRGLRVTVGTVVGLMAAGHSVEDILRLYPYLEEQDIREALAYAAWRAEEFEVPLNQA